MLGWPPRAADITNGNIEKIVSPILFNVLAWIFGFSDEPQLDDYVIVKDSQHCKLMSIAQDNLFVASSGQNATPTSISLAMTMRQLTGSSIVLKLLNHFGHCMSHKISMFGVMRLIWHKLIYLLIMKVIYHQAFPNINLQLLLGTMMTFARGQNREKERLMLLVAIILQRQSDEIQESERLSIPRSSISSLELVNLLQMKLHNIGVLADNKCTFNRNVNNQCHFEEKQRNCKQVRLHNYVFFMSVWSSMNRFTLKFKRYIGRKQII